MTVTKQSVWMTFVEGKRYETVLSQARDIKKTKLKHPSEQTVTVTDVSHLTSCS